MTINPGSELKQNRRATQWNLLLSPLLSFLSLRRGSQGRKKIKEKLTCKVIILMAIDPGAVLLRNSRVQHCSAEWGQISSIINFTTNYHYYL